MHRFRLLVLPLLLALSGCTAIQRTAHMYSEEALPPQSFAYKDGSSSVYYTYTVGNTPEPETVLFFYGATGCPSWKSVMPGYTRGLSIDARVFVLNKRFVPDRSTGLFDCGTGFHLANNPEQWLADYDEFIDAQLRNRQSKPRNVVLVGVSEGAIPALQLAGKRSAITHLAIIGSGAYSMRQSLATLKKQGATWFDVESGWAKIGSDPRSIEKNWYGNPYRWWTDIMDLDPLPDFLNLDIPILVGIGEKDRSVPVESANFLNLKFKQAGKTNLTLKIFPGADHRLNADGTSYRPEFFAELSRILEQAPSANPRKKLP